MSPPRPRRALAGQEIGTREARNERVRGSGDQLCWRPDLPQPAVDEDGAAVGEDCRVLEVVRDEEDGEIELVEKVLELGSHARSRVRVERRQRLVQKEDVGFASERARQSDALPLAARELARPRFREVGDAEALEHLGAACCGPHRRRSARRSCAGRGRTPGRRSRRVAPRAGGRSSPPRRRARARRARSSRARVGGVRRPLAGRSSCRRRRAPTSAKVSRPTASASSSRNERRGRAKSRSSVSTRG